MREAYDREFERYLVRMFLEQHPDLVAKFIDSDAAQKLPVENRLLATLALDPQTSAARVAKLLPQLDRAPRSGRGAAPRAIPRRGRSRRRAQSAARQAGDARFPRSMRCSPSAPGSMP
ncbi:MAG: hypothetical protein WDN28_26910 [Chthoniobacter sp.]